jgi:AraC-like DNA-binding protein
MSSEKIGLGVLALTPPMLRQSQFYEPCETAGCRTILAPAFKQSFGVSPQRYQNDRRIEYAKRLLANPDLSVTEVALQVGFGSSTSFAAAFRKVTGLSPSTYSRSL